MSRTSTKALFLFFLIIGGVVGITRYGEENEVQKSFIEGGLSGNGASVGDALLAGRKIDANSATAEEFALIPGIGPVKARALVQARKARGGFYGIKDLEKVDGIGPKTAEKMDKWLRFAQPFQSGGPNGESDH